MVQFLTTRLGLLLFAAGFMGCRGQTLEGAWRGPFPFDGAKDCRIRIHNDRRFDLVCRDDPSWTGAGRWRNGEDLQLDFQALVRRGTPQERVPTIRMTVIGEGNRLRLRDERGDSYVWERVRL